MMSKGDKLDRLATEDESSRQASSADSSIMGAITKVCTICGVDLHGRMRYKDSSGRYWCPNCNEKDRMSRQSAICPDCNDDFTQADLAEFKGTYVCKTCWEKRRQAARREESRLRAVEEEIREVKERKKRWMMIVGSILALLVIWSAAWVVFWVLAKANQ